MNWIRIATKMKGDPRMGAIAATCGVHVHAAVGLVACVLMELPDHARDGHLATVSDIVLEQWALWNGKPGTFARAFREHMCTPEGVVRAWERHNGAKIRESDAARKRMADARQGRKGSKRRPAPVPSDDADYADSLAYEFDEHSQNVLEVFDERSTNVPEVFVERSMLRDGTELTIGRRRPDDMQQRRQSGDVTEALEHAAQVVAPVAHSALEALLRAVPNAVTWAQLLHGYASGLSAPNQRPVGADALGQAVLEFVAAGKHERASPAAFAGFVRNASDRQRANVPTDRFLTSDDMRRQELREIREANQARRAAGQPLLDEPEWASSLDARFPEDRPSSVAA